MLGKWAQEIHFEPALVLLVRNEPLNMHAQKSGNMNPWSVIKLMCFRLLQF